MERAEFNTGAIGVISLAIILGGSFAGLAWYNNEQNIWNQKIPGGELIFNRGNQGTVTKIVPNPVIGRSMEVYRISRLDSDIFLIKAFDESRMEEAMELIRQGCNIQPDAFLSKGSERILYLEDGQCIENLVARKSAQ
jgi:hypothetical protein